jgi:hypothetical protein
MSIPQQKRESSLKYQTRYVVAYNLSCTSNKFWTLYIKMSFSAFSVTFGIKALSFLGVLASAEPFLEN